MTPDHIGGAHPHACACQTCELSRPDRKRALLERLKRELPPGSETAIRDLLGVRQVQVVPVEKPEVEHG